MCLTSVQNYGFYAMWVKKYAPHIDIVCVEPNPLIFKYLQKNLRGFDNIFLENCALSAIDGNINFDIIRQVPSIAGKNYSHDAQKMDRAKHDSRLLCSCYYNGDPL